jgi:tRNA (guanine-N7-)-methyltransferase
MKYRIRNHANPLATRNRLDPIDWDTVTAGKTRVSLDIGFGKGDFITEYATRHPTELVMGVEVRRRAVTVFHETPRPSNCLAFWGTAVVCLEDVIPSQSLDRVTIFHPDPWFKKRHHKRRVMTPQLLELLKDRLKPHGVVYISTDVYTLYNAIMQLLLSNDDKHYLSSDPFWTSDYGTHWSTFSTQQWRSLFTATFQFKASI